MNRQTLTHLGLSALSLWLLAACGAPAPTPIAQVSASPTATVTLTPTIAPTLTPTPEPTFTPTPTSTPTPTPLPNPLDVQYMRQQTYPGSDLVIERELPRGGNYTQAIVSYQSAGNKLYALLTIPIGDRPPTGWPIIVFNHGYIPPAVYRTVEDYQSHVRRLASSGYIVIKPDYRGHADSEGESRGGYGQPDYTVDVLNAVAAIKRHPDADPKRLGMYGHSMGGHITLRAMVTTSDIKAGVIWAGVVASYADLLDNWRRPIPASIPPQARRWREELVTQHGSPAENPAFWNSISPIAFAADVSGPIQLHHGTNDADVPTEFSDSLNQALLNAGREVEYFVYPGDNHNLLNNWGTVMARTVAFFDKHVKGEQAASN